MREVLASHKELARKIDEMEKKYDVQFKVVFEAIKQLMGPPSPASKRKYGFLTSRDANGGTKGRR
ncbi:MAG: hypothetical protein FJY66_02675 [Calditrichaeota bacterium]|nr:hypothetical protein [Calditrichota bacterium]